MKSNPLHALAVYYFCVLFVSFLIGACVPKTQIKESPPCIKVEVLSAFPTPFTIVTDPVLDSGGLIMDPDFAITCPVPQDPTPPSKAYRSLYRANQVLQEKYRILQNRLIQAENENEVLENEK